MQHTIYADNKKRIISESAYLKIPLILDENKLKSRFGIYFFIDRLKN